MRRTKIKIAAAAESAFCKNDFLADMLNAHINTCRKVMHDSADRKLQDKVGTIVPVAKLATALASILRDKLFLETELVQGAHVRNADRDHVAAMATRGAGRPDRYRKPGLTAQSAPLTVPPPGPTVDPAPRDLSGRIAAR